MRQFRSNRVRRKQRWIPAVNTTAETVPPYAIVEVLSAGPISDYRVDHADDAIILEIGRVTTEGDFKQRGDVEYTYLPGAGYSNVADDCEPFRTIWTVHKFAFNSHLPIPPNRTGRVTVDLPTLAIVEQNTSAGSALTVDGGIASVSDVTGLPKQGTPPTWFLRKLVDDNWTVGWHLDGLTFNLIDPAQDLTTEVTGAEVAYVSYERIFGFRDGEMAINGQIQ